MDIKYLLMLMTDDCNMECSFCCRRGVKKNPRILTKKMAEDIVEWAVGGEHVKNFDEFSVHFWGGEPTLVPEVMEHMLEKYQQLKFSANTNGIALNTSKKIRDIFRAHSHHYTMQLSSTIAYELHGFDRYVKDFKAALSEIAWNNSNRGNWSVNLVLIYPDKFYDNLMQLYDMGIKNLAFDFPLHKKIDEEYIDKAKECLIRVYGERRDNYPLLAGSGYVYNLSDNLKLGYDCAGTRYCGTGTNRCLADFDGNLWACDGFYELKKHKIGNIYGGMDLEALEMFESLKSQPHRLEVECVDCEYSASCLRPKCLAANQINSGSYYKLDKDWCKCSKILMDVKKYFKNKPENIIDAKKSSIS